MKRGPKPLPAVLKLVTGNAGKRPIQDEVKPVGEVKKPAFVTGKSAKIWQQYAPSLQAQGVLTVWDVDMFGAWCYLMAEFQRAPEMFTAAKLTQMRTLGEAFCLLPTGRSRFKPSGKTEDEDTAEQYFRRG